MECGTKLRLTPGAPMHSRRTVTFVATPIFVALATVAAYAQTSTPEATSVDTATQVVEAPTSPTSERMPGWGDLFKPLKGDFQRLGSTQNLLVASFGAASAMTAHSWDTRIATSEWGQGR